MDKRTLVLEWRRERSGKAANSVSILHMVAVSLLTVPFPPFPVSASCFTIALAAGKFCSGGAGGDEKVLWKKPEIRKERQESGMLSGERGCAPWF